MAVGLCPPALVGVVGGDSCALGDACGGASRWAEESEPGAQLWRQLAVSLRDSPRNWAGVPASGAPGGRLRDNTVQ